MSTNTISSTSKLKATYQLISIILYVLTIVVASALLLIEPNNFDARAMIIPLIVLLFVTSIGIGNKIASKNENKIISIVGTIALTILMTFVGFFIVAAVAWFVGVSHAQ